MRVTQKDLDKILEERRSGVIVHCRVVRGIAGGLPAEANALKAFIEHHLGIPPMVNGQPNQDFEDAFARINDEEIGTHNVTPSAGALTEEKVYGVNVLRRSKHGPYIGAHQIHALIKQAASRMGVFVRKRGSKGDVTELGTVLAHGESQQAKSDPTEAHPDGRDRYDEIYLRNEDGSGPAETHFDVKNGSVTTAGGKRSIQHHTEVCQEEATFSFEFRWLPGKFTERDMLETFAAATAIGQGSCLSFGHGKFEVISMDIEEGTGIQRKVAKKEVKKKEQKEDRPAA